jgi:hypothetical protein
LTGCSEQQGIAEDSGGSDVWVGCAGSATNGTVAVMSPSGSLVRSFTLAGGASSPSGIAQDGTSGDVVVADATANTLDTVSTTATVGSVALPAGSSPANVAYANVGGVFTDYVADPGNGSVQRCQRGDGHSAGASGEHHVARGDECL